MNKYALLCAVVIAAPVVAEVERSADRSGKELAAEVVKATLRSGDEEATRSSCKCGKCSSCSSCKSCSKCCGCKSVEMNEEATEEAAETKCACGGKPQQKTVEAGDEGTAETRKCSSCGCSCGKCGCN